MVRLQANELAARATRVRLLLFDVDGTLTDGRVLIASDVAYMGDDLLDLPILAQVGLSGAPADAAPEVLARVHWVSQARGGHGAAREFIELVLRARQAWEPVISRMSVGG